MISTFFGFLILLSALSAIAIAQEEKAAQEERPEFVIIGQSIMANPEKMDEMIAIWAQIGKELQEMAPGRFPEENLQSFLDEMRTGATQPQAPQSMEAPKLMAAIRNTPTYQRYRQLDTLACPFFDYFGEGVHFHRTDENGMPTLDVSGLHVQRPFAMEIEVAEYPFNFDPKFDPSKYGYERKPETKYFNFMKWPNAVRADQPWKID